ncbi:DUF922 domain-containing protein [Pontibacter sp. Tf4]|uniref:DUF922 domain-containing protein n=1 Tax=Pontibacter sp. Tf4 TaxID=2761620 RepID=UPI00162428AB|nr:DUF922 domain-containing protein [Pontibacter sp. Tf4]MBB6610034.1 DUF922 domain-containing protein [Pontibacter sp. Tf4]
MNFIALFLSLLTGYIAPAPVLAKPVSEEKKAAKTEQIAWSADRRLAWSDFKASPDTLNPHHALTAANLAVDAKCNANTFAYDVKCVFLATESWTKNTRSEKLLHHEQLHFDLTEVHARQLRKNLQALGTSCPDAKPRLAAVVNAAFADWKADQEKFDEQSRHGLDAKVSEVWEQNIAKRLKQLEKFKS